MKREWRPGDVAVVTDSMGRSGRGICNPHGGWDFTPTGAKLACYASAKEITEASQLVVIDPEDECGDLSNLWHLLPENLVSIDQLQAALREFANPSPPKPDEPTGLGAVVEQHGARWTHVGAGRWVQCLNDGRVSNGLSWDDFTSVVVLSEGVTL